MNGFRNWFSRYMIGRYGSDEFNRFLLIIGAILIVIGIFVPRHFLDVLVVAVLIIVYCRMFSRNIAKRQQENMKYLQLKAKVTGSRGGSGGYGSGGYGAGYSGQGAGPRPAGGGAAGSGAGSPFRKKKRPEPGKRIFICPNCKGSLQVPVGAGKIRIKCPHCGSEFEETV